MTEKYTSVTSSAAASWLIIISSLFRSVFLVLINFIINLISLVLFRKSVEKNKKIKFSIKDSSESNESTASRNLTRMVIIMGFINVFGSVPTMVVYISQQFINLNSVFYVMFTTLAQLIYLLAISSDMCVYLYFNKVYRETFRNVFLRFL
ncbi:unnamed protein product [Brachionus calyciflorus]|uniref:G-protein coupled receptors family 1 profile domain-containing protein n=1 Tax=Brachionus calyciflorus TaxID=104777 RepID=A0A813Y2U1_9BILA|nr:unnamed protein product [Brachionus calyciflorus]